VNCKELSNYVLGLLCIAALLFILYNLWIAFK